VLDQLLAGAGDDGITYARAVTLLGVTDVALIDDMVAALAAQDGATVFATIDRLVEAGHDPRRFASDLLQRFRDLVLLRVAPEQASQGLVDAPAEQLVTMTTQADALGAASLTRFAEITHNGLIEMRGATAPRLLLELLCARMLLPSAADGDGAVLHRLERLERRLTIAQTATGGPPAADSPDVHAEHSSVADPASAPPARGPKPPNPQAPNPEAHGPQSQGPQAQRPETQRPEVERPQAQHQPAPGQPDVAAVRQAWQALLDAVREQSRATQVLFSNATATAVDGATLVLTLPTAPLARRLGEERNVEMIKRALHSVLGVDWQVRCEHTGGDAGSSGAPTPQRTPERTARPPQRSPQRPTSRPSAPPQSPDDSIPLPPEPPDTGDPRAAAPPQTPMDDEAMLAEAANMSREHPSRRDPEEAALELLAAQLGARRIDES
jgi:DNA polymerase-3 subunit gamma/tau